MNSFLKNLLYIAITGLIFAVPILLTLSFCLGWDVAIQDALWAACLFDFLAVLILVIAFADVWNKEEAFMSGGSLDYFFSQLREHAGDFGDAELDDLVKDLADLFYRREWYTSGDTSEGDWREARKAFKQKWLYKGSRDERFRHYIEEAVEKLRDDFGLNDHKRCETCQHWTQERENYGSCKFESEGYTHKGEVCKKWEEKEDAKALEIQL